jgi:hypothetical protein
MAHNIVIKQNKTVKESGLPQLRWVKDSAGVSYSLWSLVRRGDNVQQLGVECHVDNGSKKHFLKKVFLRLARLILFGILRGLDFFHEVAMPVTMQPGFIPVFAKLGGNVLLVKLKARIDKVSRQVH